MKIIIWEDKIIKDNYIENYSKREFEILNEIIEYDQEHNSLLDEPNYYLRYHDIRPYSYNNVQIDSGHKYINASWIHIPKLRYFIATQGPIPNTIEDFWIMCNQYDVEKIIMLCELNENNMEKCAKYWDPKLMNNFEIKTIEESDVSKGIKSRVFKL